MSDLLALAVLYLMLAFLRREAEQRAQHEAERQEKEADLDPDPDWYDDEFSELSSPCHCHQRRLKVPTKTGG